MVIYVDLCRYTYFFFCSHVTPSGWAFSVYPTLIVSSRSGASGDFGAGRANVASVGETCSCCWSAIPSMQDCWYSPTNPKYPIFVGPLSSFLEFTIPSHPFLIPFMPKAAVFYFQLKIFSMLSCCKCEPQISNMINSSNQVDKPTLLYPHSLHPTQAGLAEAHHRLRTFKTSVSSEVQGVTNTEVPWLLLCLGWIHGYRL